MDVWVEHANLGDALDGKPVAGGRPADRLGARTVVDTEGLPAVLAHVGMEPGDTKLAVALEFVLAHTGRRKSCLETQTLRELALHHVPRHLARLLSSSRHSRRTYAGRRSRR